ncbi:DNA adenine methylase [Candidatus Phytoplasma sp. AldY-WA1]|uniref:DNA adenine methylase n=1 Tax=Candidatus Phytoplasma sp. AldY-WA1 TaxID=2852100 RepID=UPI002549E1F0|nr:DNA adenine methylase [Candidatus Phytoplasma sp. AldY-WA1]
MKINCIDCKKRMISQIIEHMPSKFNTYYEPFLGSGALYFHLKPKKAILNDNDSQLITMWQQSFQNPQDFVNKVKITEDYIYQQQEQQDQKLAYKILLNEYNKYSFCGITRYNKKNHLSTSFGYKPKQKAHCFKKV